MIHDPNEDRAPGLYLTIRLDSVRETYNHQRLRADKAAVTIAEADGQRFSPSVMAALLHAIADEVYDNQPADLPF